MTEIDLISTDEADDVVSVPAETEEETQTETVAEVPADTHDFMTTNFSDYTVTEGLLLLIFVLLLLSFFANLLRRWF